MQTTGSRSIGIVGAIVATTASILGVSPARAATYDVAAASEVRHATITLRGITLSSPAGRAMVDRQIRSAARRVCGPMEWAASPSVVTCRRIAIADARARLDEKAMLRFAAR